MTRLALAGLWLGFVAINAALVVAVLAVAHVS